MSASSDRSSSVDSPGADSTQLLADVVDGTEVALRRYFDSRADEVALIGEEYRAAVDVLSRFVLLGGKRVRPLFAYLGWLAVPTGEGRSAPDRPDSDAAIATFAALELVQACALIHDDIIDRSDTRRGRPTAHRQFEATHRGADWSGDAAHYGVSAAVIVGDLALAWADDMIADAPITPEALRRVRSIWSIMRTEVLGGQLLDIVTEASGNESIDAAYRVMRHKTAGYTVSRPLTLGAALAGADEELQQTLLAAGTDLGLAFQLRDDVLGVFGDAARTGKPSGDDLVAAKRTALLAVALRRAHDRDPALADRLRALIGHPLTEAELDEARAIFVDVGALEEIETTIDELTTRAFDRLRGADAEPTAVGALASFTARLAHRES